MAVAGYTKNNKNFIRAYRLLIDIGSPVLRDYLKKLVHIQGFGTIDDFLKHHSKRFRKRLRDKKLQKYQYDSLYPTGGQTVDPETWDISLLCLLLRENFTLSPIERQAVDTLRRVRNTVFGHTPVTCLDDVQFEDVWTDLERAIVSILHHTGDKQAEKETLEKIRHVRDKRIDADESVLDDIRHKLERLISLTESYERETDAEDDKTKLQKFLVKAYSEYTDFGSHLVCPLRAGYRLLVDNIYVDEQFRDITPRGMVSVNYLNPDPNDQVIQNSLQASFKNLFEPCDTNVSPRHVVLVGEAGRGKTTYCLKLLSRWCSAMRKLLEGQQEFTETEEELMQFELLYFISLRHAIEEESVVDMIESQILTENGQLMATVKKYFQSMPEKSLVIIDGLDEWPRCTSRKIPKRNDLNFCPILWTTRHSQLHLLSSLANSRVLEVLQLDEESIRSLVRHVLAEFYRLPANSVSKQVSNFMADLRHQGMRLVAEIPLVLTYLVCLWHDEHGLQESRTVNFCGILNQLLQNVGQTTETKRNQTRASKQSMSLPGVLKFYENVEKESSLMRPLCPFAYDCCLQSLIVFPSGQVEAIIGEDNMTKCLSSGLLSQTHIQKSTPKQQVRIQFFHKTLQELLAAIWISSKEARGRALRNMLSLCGTTEKIIEMSTVLTFACGLNPNQAVDISQHIAKITLYEVELIQYRHSLQSRYSFRRPRDVTASYRRIRRIQQIVIDCEREGVLNSRYCGGTSDRWSTHFGSVFAIKTTGTVFILHDIVIADRVQAQTLQILIDSVDQLRSIYVDLPMSEKCDQIQDLICQTNQLQRLHLDDTCSPVIYRLSQTQMERIYSLCLSLERVPMLPTLMNHLRSITALCLSISGSHRMVQDLECFLQASKQLKELELEKIICNEHMREMDTCRYLIDVRASKNLQRLRLQDVSSLCTMLPDSVQLEEIWLSGAASNPSSCLCRLPGCRSLSTLILGHLNPIRSWSRADYETILYVLPKLRHLEYLYLIGINFERYGAIPRVSPQRTVKQISLELVQLSRRGWIELLVGLAVSEHDERECEAEIHLISTNLQKYRDVFSKVYGGPEQNNVARIVLALKDTKCRKRLLSLERLKVS